jgi:hypothetical protein
MRDADFKWKNNGKEITYNGVIIEENDIKEGVLKNFGGFIYAGSVNELEGILNNDTESRAIIACNKNDGFDGNGISCRAVGRTINAKTVFDSVNSVGYSKPIYYFMPAEASAGLGILHTSSIRIRSNKSITESRLLKDPNQYESILQQANSDSNCTEVVFYHSIPFDKITDIFIDINLKSKKNIKRILNEIGFRENGKIEKYVGAYLHSVLWFSRNGIEYSLANRHAKKHQLQKNSQLSEPSQPSRPSQSMGMSQPYGYGGFYLESLYLKREGFQELSLVDSDDSSERQSKEISPLNLRNVKYEEDPCKLNRNFKGLMANSKNNGISEYEYNRLNQRKTTTNGEILDNQNQASRRKHETDNKKSRSACKRTGSVFKQNALSIIDYK